MSFVFAAFTCAAGGGLAFAQERHTRLTEAAIKSAVEHKLEFALLDIFDWVEGEARNGVVTLRGVGAAQSPASAPPSPCWLRDIAAVSDREVWVVCESGWLLHTADGGSTWTRRQAPADVPLRAVAFLDERRGFVGGGRGLLLATGDGGQTWQRVETGADHDLTDLFFVGQHGWASGYWGTILHTADGGQTWQRQLTLVSQPLEKLYFVNQRTGWAVGWMQTILHTNDGGLTWQRQTSQESALTLTAIYFRDERHGWAVGMQGLILRTTDGGRNWTRQPAPVAERLNDIAFTASGSGLIVGTGETLLLSHDGGASWQKAAAPLEGSLRALAVRGDRVWGAGWGILLTSADGGRAWASRPIGELTPKEITVKPASTSRPQLAPWLRVGALFISKPLPKTSGNKFPSPSHLSRS